MSRAIAIAAHRACLASMSLTAPRALSIPATRSFQTSPSLMKKNRKALEVEESFDNESDPVEEEEDLFAVPSSSTTIRDPSAQLQPLLTQIQEIMALPTDERKAAFSNTRVGVLRRVVQLYPAEEIEGLKGVLRSWRSLGGRVTRKTAEELVGRLCNLERADLALELINDRTQYGLPPLPTHSQTRLHQALLQSPTSSVPALSQGIPVSKTLATLHLALRQKASQDPISQNELSRLVSQIKKVKIETKDSEELRKEARGGLERAGGIWADAAKRIEGVTIA